MGLTMSDQRFRMFERLTALVSREGVLAGETGEVSRVYGDGSVEIEIVERNDPPTQVYLGILANRPSCSRRARARFAAAEVARSRA